MGRPFYKLFQGVVSSNNLFLRMGFQIPNVVPVAPNFIIKGAFTPNVKSELSENLGGILGGTQC
jgi:hypothetical protein